MEKLDDKYSKSKQARKNTQDTQWRHLNNFDESPEIQNNLFKQMQNNKYEDLYDTKLRRLVYVRFAHH
jgi:hypothetical protein